MTAVGQQVPWPASPERGPFTEGLHNRRVRTREHLRGRVIREEPWCSRGPCWKKVGGSVKGLFGKREAFGSPAVRTCQSLWILSDLLGPPSAKPHTGEGAPLGPSPLSLLLLGESWGQGSLSCGRTPACLKNAIGTTLEPRPREDGRPLVVKLLEMVFSGRAGLYPDSFCHARDGAKVLHNHRWGVSLLCPASGKATLFCPFSKIFPML